MQFFEVVVFCQTAVREVCTYLNPINITKELAFSLQLANHGHLKDFLKVLVGEKLYVSVVSTYIFLSLK